MNKSDFIKEITKEVFGTTKISNGKLSENNLNRYGGYFLKCTLNEKSCTRFNELFTVSLTVEKSMYEKHKDRISLTDKKQIINNFSEYIFNRFDIIIYNKIKDYEQDPNLDKYNNIIIKITKNIISPELFCGTIKSVSISISSISSAE